MIEKLNITVDVKPGNPQITEYSLLTLKTLEEMFKSKQSLFDHRYREARDCNVILYYVVETKSFKLSEQPNLKFGENTFGVDIVEVTFKAEYPNFKYQANKMMNALWDREFPLHVKVIKIQEISERCGEFLDWVRDHKEYQLAQYHEHTESCYDEEIYQPEKGERGPYCRMSDQMLYTVNVQTEDLLFEFFGIDRKKFQAEKDRMLREIK